MKKRTKGEKKMNRALVMFVAILAMAIMFCAPVQAEQLGVFEKAAEAVLDNVEVGEISKIERFTLESRGKFIVGSVISATVVDNHLAQSLSGRLIGVMDNTGQMNVTILWDNAPREEREFSLSYDKETLTPIRGGCFIPYENSCVVAGDGDYDRVPNN